MNLTVVDTQISNQNSVLNAFRTIGATVTVATTSDELEHGDAIVLPGVGAFEPAMDRLNITGMGGVICRRVRNDRVPLIGICLGMQLLASASEENGYHAGLDLIPGTVRRLEPRGTAARIPNIGWCDVTASRSGKLFDNPDEKRSFYFVHSFYFDCDEDENVAATIEFADAPVTVAVERGNVMGVQFHPEKSQDAGLDLLARTVERIGATSL